jgi:hypothetical protein
MQFNGNRKFNHEVHDHIRDDDNDSLESDDQTLYK